MSSTELPPEQSNDETSNPESHESDDEAAHFMDDGRLGFREAAVLAEFETGKREPTARSAWFQVLFRMVRIGFGVSVVGLGVVMLALPGPGLLVLSVGLGILARDIAWADRLLQKVMKRLPTNEQGKLSRSAIVTMVLLALAGIFFSVAYAVGGWSIFFWRS